MKHVILRCLCRTWAVRTPVCSAISFASRAPGSRRISPRSPCQAEEWAASSGTLPELAFYGGSFTAIDLETQTALLESAAQLKKDGRISRVRLSTRPDALGAEVLARLAHYGVDTVEIGVQSLDDEVLAASQRGHTAAQAEGRDQTRAGSGISLRCADDGGAAGRYTGKKPCHRSTACAAGAGYGAHLSNGGDPRHGAGGSVYCR